MRAVTRTTPHASAHGVVARLVALVEQAIKLVARAHRRQASCAGRRERAAAKLAAPDTTSRTAGARGRMCAMSRPRRGPTVSSRAVRAADDRTEHAELRVTRTAPRAPAARQPRTGPGGREGRGETVPHRGRRVIARTQRRARGSRASRLVRRAAAGREGPRAPRRGRAEASARRASAPGPTTRHGCESGRAKLQGTRAGAPRRGSTSSGPHRAATGERGGGLRGTPGPWAVRHGRAPAAPRPEPSDPREGNQGGEGRWRKGRRGSPRDGGRADGRDDSGFGRRERWGEEKETSGSGPRGEEREMCVVGRGR
jgi:hypothetical protein